MTRFSKLWMAIAALTIAAFAMVAANYLVATFLAVGLGMARRHPRVFEILPPVINFGVVFFIIGVGGVRWRASRRHEGAGPADRWAQLRLQHTQLAEQLLPPDSRELALRQRDRQYRMS